MYYSCYYSEVQNSIWMLWVLSRDIVYSQNNLSYAQYCSFINCFIDLQRIRLVFVRSACHIFYFYFYFFSTKKILIYVLVIRGSCFSYWTHLWCLQTLQWYFEDFHLTPVLLLLLLHPQKDSIDHSWSTFSLLIYL